jgi:hypothetical protein
MVLQEFRRYRLARAVTVPKDCSTPQGRSWSQRHVSRTVIVRLDRRSQGNPLRALAESDQTSNSLLALFTARKWLAG